jgi:hypothetical protein
MREKADRLRSVLLSWNDGRTCCQKAARGSQEGTGRSHADDGGSLMCPSFQDREGCRSASRSPGLEDQAWEGDLREALAGMRALELAEVLRSWSLTHPGVQVTTGWTTWFASSGRRCLPPLGRPRTHRSHGSHGSCGQVAQLLVSPQWTSPSVRRSSPGRHAGTYRQLPGSGRVGYRAFRREDYGASSG